MKNLKSLYYISITYLLFGLFTGIFYHEVAYYTNFTDVSVLKYVHPHALFLGTLIFMIIPIFVKVFSIDKNKYFKKFIITYNLGLAMSLLFMSIRGITQLFQIQISNFSDHMIGGLAGIGHVILSIGLYFLFRTLIYSTSNN